MDDVLVDANDDLDKQLKDAGMAQNKSKQEIQLWLHGKNKIKRRRMIEATHDEDKGQIVYISRYLGGRYHVDGYTYVERQYRLKAIQVAWTSFRPFFVSSAMFRFRRLVFMSVVYNAGTSGLEAYAMTKSDYDAIETCILKYARVLLKGAGCDKSKQEEDDTGTIKYKAMTNDDVWRRLGLTPCRLEVSIRKMKWMQNVAEHPHDNAYHH